MIEWKPGTGASDRPHGPAIASNTWLAGRQRGGQALA